jgi:hypothetical protein
MADTKNAYFGKDMKCRFYEVYGYVTKIKMVNKVNNSISLQYVSSYK